MCKEKELLNIAMRISALAQTGLVYSESEYDTERYQEYLELSHKITAIVSGNKLESIRDAFRIHDDYVTPMVDVRAVIFNEKGELLLVKERADGLWALPGGWADVGFTPQEVAVKEVQEETGLNVRPVKLLAVLDKKCHDHPPHQHYVYKIFIRCEVIDGDFTEAFDILGKDFFPQTKLPPLSTERNMPEQIDLMFEFLNDPDKRALVD